MIVGDRDERCGRRWRIEWDHAIILDQRTRVRVGIFVATVRVSVTNWKLTSDDEMVHKTQVQVEDIVVDPYDFGGYAFFVEM